MHSMTYGLSMPNSVMHSMTYRLLIPNSVMHSMTYRLSMPSHSFVFLQLEFFA